MRNCESKNNRLLVESEDKNTVDSIVNKAQEKQ